MPDRRYLKTKGLVLRTRILGEADRLIIFLTWERGKIAAVARGARKIKSKLAPAVDLFTYGTYRFYLGRGLATVTGAEVIRHFHALAFDPLLYWNGLRLAGLVDRLLDDAAPCLAVCHLLLSAWCLFEKGPSSPGLLARAVELQLLHLGGYTPHLDGCLECGSPKIAFFSAARGGVLCPGCAGSGCLVMNRGTAALAKRLIETPLKMTGQVRAGKQQMQELIAMLRLFWRFHLEMDLRTDPPFATGPDRSNPLLKPT